MMKSLEGRRAYVTGGSSGIGAAIVEAFANAGAAVAIGASKRARNAEVLADRIRGKGGTAHVIVGDLSDRAATDAAAKAAIQALGGLDIFVHCAGIDVTKTAPTHETPDDTWDRMMSIHLTAAFRLSKALIPEMLNGTKPSILFIGSVAGVVAWQDDVAYNVAKAGLHHLARCIAADYARQGLRANAIAPGVIDTPLTRGYASGMEGGEGQGMQVLAGLHPIGRYATPDEVAGTALFLSSDAAGFITGVVLPVDGGMTMI
ncbi:MAG: SDR family oxidoreductase [Mesorhizobium sp.]|nr:SDR family NAD(P)-dependent oxidoreductase [Mesorhizobium sp.]MBL8580363.1 SDR family oxidoreductase [Mesorhizobium sp.]